MKKTLFLITLIFVCLTNLFAQSDSTKWIASVQYGYMGELVEWLNPGYNTWVIAIPPVQSNINPASYGKIRNGSFISFEVERKMKKKGYSIGMSFIRGQVSFRMNDVDRLFWDKDATENYEIVSLFFNKEINLNKKNSLIFGLGVSNFSFQRLTIDETQFGSTKKIEYFDYSTSDLGFIFNLQYINQIRKNIGIGIQVKTLHSTVNFLEAIMVAPTLRFKIY